MLSAGATLRAAIRSVLSRAGAGRPLRLVLIGAVGVCLSLALTASAQVRAGASANRARVRTAGEPFPLSVRQISLRKLGGRIMGTATITNTGTSPVRSTTGVLGLIRDPGPGA